MTRPKLLMFPAIVAAALASASAASAQGVIQYDDPYYGGDPGPATVYRQDYYRDYYPDYRVRTYEYSVRPSGPNGCGTYHFWNGVRCVDARYR
jgi:hypothetical protein